MKISQLAVLYCFSCILGPPLTAQPSIGGGTCNSASLNGGYAVSITGRQVTVSGTFANVMQANGSATFDGLSKVTLALTTDTLQAVGTPLTWSGTYSIQANCAGTMSITNGASATFSIGIFGSGANFLLTGNDSTYAYAGNGNNTPGTCSTSTVSGVYTFNATGFTLAGNSVTGAQNGAGLLQFDGQGHLTMNVTFVASGATPNALTLTGSYSVSSTCLGSATLTDSKSNTYVLNLSITNATKLYSSDFFVALAQASKFIVTGSGHAIYNQPTAHAADPQLWPRPRPGTQGVASGTISGERA